MITYLASVSTALYVTNTSSIGMKAGDKERGPQLTQHQVRDLSSDLHLGSLQNCTITSPVNVIQANNV